MTTAPLGIQQRVDDAVSAVVTPIGDRRVVWVELGGRTASGFRGVPLSSATSAVVETAARTGTRPRACRW